MLRKVKLNIVDSCIECISININLIVRKLISYAFCKDELMPCLFDQILYVYATIFSSKTRFEKYKIVSSLIIMYLG